MFSNFYVESGDFKACVMSDSNRNAVLHALTDLKDELEDSSTIPRLESLIRVSPNGWQENGFKEYIDDEVEFLDSNEVLRELGYDEVLGCLQRQEQEYRQIKPEEA